MIQIRISINIFFLFALIFIVAVGVVEAQRNWTGVYEFGGYQVRFDDICNERFYDMVDVVRDTQHDNGWLVVCVPHKDGQETIGFMHFEDIIKQKEGGGREQEVVNDDVQNEKAPDDSEESVVFETGEFSIWIEDLKTGLTNFISGEVLCKDEYNTQPEKGRIVSLEGEAFIGRGIKTVAASEGMTLVGGDILSLREGASATIDLKDTGRLNISEKTRFQIPRSPYECAKNEIVFSINNGVNKAWHWIKDVMRGESYEIKSPSGTPGVRG